MKKLLWVMGVSVLGLGAASTQALFKDAKTSNIKEPEAVFGEYVVKFRTHSSQGLSALANQSNLNIKKIVHADSGLALVDLRDFSRQALKSVDRFELRNHVVAELSKDPNIEYIEPNFIYRASVIDEAPQNIPNDANFESLWGMHNLGQKDPAGQAGIVDADIDAPEAWALTTGSKDVVVAVIDTGVDYNHQDLKDNIWSMPGKPDVHGYNAINGQLDPMDDHNHGTHCSGTIGGQGANNIGVAGVTWNVSIMGVKFLSGSGGGTLADAIKAIDWATQNGAQIMSNSWGGGGYSEALKESIMRANDKGILFVAAAGNDSANNDSTPSYPASYEVPNVVAVAATTNSDGLAYFSNYGRRTVHLAAPGHNIYSTTRGNTYASYSGTSMATPHVSGAAALLLAHEPGLTVSQLRDRLLKSTDKIPGLRSKTATRGGRLNVNNALRNILPPGAGDVPDNSWGSVNVAPVASAHPYVDNANQRWEISSPGATYMRIQFGRFETEAGYDKVMIKDAKGTLMEEFSGNLSNGVWTDAVAGDKIIIEFVSDYSENRWGFELKSAESTTWSE